MYSVKYGTTYTTNTDKSFSRTFKGVEGETDTIVIKTLGASNQLDFVNIWKGGGNPSDVISDTEGDLFGASGSISFSNPVVEENINFNILENDYASTLQLVNLEGSIVAESFISSANVTMDISELKPGIYILRDVERPESYAKVIINK